MQEVLALSLQAMQKDMMRLDRIGTNLANAMTPGYKREVMTSGPSTLSAASFPMLVTAASASTALEGTAQSRPAPFINVQSDARPGTLKSTGQTLDVALAGDGYFEVTTDTGPAYTRQGNFQLDARGRLVTAQGFAVMGKAGEIYLNLSQPVIDASGKIFESGGTIPGAQPLAELKIVQFDNPHNLKRLGDGLVAAPDAGVNVMKDADIQVRQGFLENSNVNSMHEMVQLIQTMRHFESMQKVALSYDDMTSQAVRKLGELS